MLPTFSLVITTVNVKTVKSPSAPCPRYWEDNSGRIPYVFHVPGLSIIVNGIV